ncbi:MAG: argS [Micavibrio sp.]|nr:argS [Micavibrio sp.]
MSLLQKLSAVTGEAFAAEGLPAEMGHVRVSDRPDLAQFQCNGAMSAAKTAKKNPRAVAEAIVARLKDNPLFSKIEIAGPGFINLNVTDDVLSAFLKDNAKDGRYGFASFGAGETMVLDYGGPNVAKAMHVGHLRPCIIGDALRRMALFAGYKAIGDVHLGDWGTPMGMIISALEMLHPDWPYFDADFKGEYPKESPVTMADLEQIYPKASAACKEDPARMDAARRATMELQDGRAGYRALWKHFVAVSIAGIKVNYDALGVHFDLWKGEADVHDLIAPMVQDLEKRGFAVKDDGATIVPIKKNDDEKEFPPLILYKRDGAVMYGTTDLATIVERVQLYHPSKIVYVVDQRQSLHFEQVFRAARLSGIAPDAIELTHAGFGTMNGADGKPFKTRAGGVMRLEDMIEMATEAARTQMKEAGVAQDADAAEQERIANQVAVAAIKFADLQNQRQSDYIFDLNRFTSFEGKTGPYLQYQAVRVKSLLKKAEAQNDQSSEYLIVNDENRALALLLSELPEALALSLRNYTPHVLCDHVYRLANAFSSFYGNCHILSEPDAGIRANRLRLCRMVMEQLVLVLDLLGIVVPERM